jgi:hypothetical protein
VTAAGAGNATGGHGCGGAAALASPPELLAVVFVTPIVPKHLPAPAVELGALCLVGGLPILATMIACGAAQG